MKIIYLRPNLSEFGPFLVNKSVTYLNLLELNQTCHQQPQQIPQSINISNIEN